MTLEKLLVSAAERLWAKGAVPMSRGVSTISSCSSPGQQGLGGRPSSSSSSPSSSHRAREQAAEPRRRPCPAWEGCDYVRGGDGSSNPNSRPFTASKLQHMSK